MLIDLGDKYFPHNLIYLRKKYALSRKALARLIGISEYRLEAIEKGTCRPAVEFYSLRRLQIIFNLTTNELGHRMIEYDD